MSKSNKLIEKTLVIIKPDAVQRGLTGTIFEYLEEVGLKLLTAKMVKPDEQVIKNHYPGTKEWIVEMGKKTLSSFKQSNLDIKNAMGTDDPHKLGKFVYERLVNYWKQGPIVVCVWEGPQAVSLVRKIRGHTIPLLADPGTIHARHSYDSSPLSVALDRVVETFVHASGDVAEAQREILYWFGTTDFKSYERDVDSLYLK